MEIIFVHFLVPYSLFFILSPVSPILWSLLFFMKLNVILSLLTNPPCFPAQDLLLYGSILGCDSPVAEGLVSSWLQGYVLLARDLQAVLSHSSGRR
jgi:hypothetical protein